VAIYGHRPTDSDKKTMKVKDVLEFLKDKDPETLLIVEGYESGYDHIHEEIDTIYVTPSESKNWWDGALKKANSAKAHKALLLSAKTGRKR